MLILLNRNIEEKKAELLAKIFKLYISEIIHWYDFCEITITLEALVLRDFELLQEINNYAPDKTEREIGRISSLKRLVALGLIRDYQNKPPVQITKEYPDRTSYATTNYGKLFCRSIS